MKAKKTLSLIVFALMLSLVPCQAFADDMEINIPVTPEPVEASLDAKPAGFSLMSLFQSNNPTRKSGEHAKFIDRVNLEPFAKNFYDALVEATDGNGVKDYLMNDDYISYKTPTIGELNTAGSVIRVGSSESLDSPAVKAFIAGGVEVTQAEKESIVKWSSVNHGGLLTEPSVYSSMRNQIFAALSAFDRDHPEVFWLSNTYYVMILTANNTNTVYPCIYISGDKSFFSGASKDFDFRYDEFNSTEKIQNAIQAMNKAIDTIIAAEKAQSGPNSTPYEKIRYFNDWLTTHNQYCTQSDINSVNNGYVRKAIGALLGRAGAEGPVCESYARAMMVLCNKVGIECCLSSGDATHGGSAEAHMWNLVNIGGKWYGLDSTWNDPSSSASSGSTTGPISGSEGAAFLLVGSNDVVINNLTFKQTRNNPTNMVFSSIDYFRNEPQIEPTRCPCPAGKEIQKLPSSPYSAVGNVKIGKAGYDNGHAVLPSLVTYSCNGTTLQKDVDFVIDGFNNTGSPNSKGDLEIRPIGKYNAIKIVDGVDVTTAWLGYKFDIVNPVAISAVQVNGLTTPQAYTGKAVQPQVTLSDGGSQLTEGLDYEVEYSNNTNAGQGTVKIKGLGVYTGERSDTFQISPHDISDIPISGIQQSYEYTGKTINPTPSMSFGDVALSSPKDITVTYGANTNVSDTCEVRIQGTGNFTGNKTQSFTITPVQLTSDKVSFGTIQNQTFTGSPITPTLIPTFDGKNLNQGSDFNVVAESNTNAGTANLKFTGQGNFSGEKSVGFTIDKANMSSVKVDGVQKSYLYTGEAVVPEYTLTLGSYSLKPEDYTATLAGNDKVGQATLTLTGKGTNFEGEQILNFSIGKQSIEDAEVTLTFPDGKDSYTFTNEKKEPPVTVMLGGKQLNQGDDFDVEYKDNINASDAAKVIVKGKNNYEGEVTKTFTIKPCDLSTVLKLDGALPTYTWSGSAISPKPEGLTYGDMALEENVHYTVGYENNDKPGQANLLIIGKEPNFTGTYKQPFTIKKGKPNLVITQNKVEMSSSAKSVSVPIQFDGDSNNVQLAVKDSGTCEASYNNKNVIITPKSAGSTTIDVTVQGTDYYEQSETKTISVTVEEASVAKKTSSVTLSPAGPIEMNVGDKDTVVTIGGTGGSTISVKSDNSEALGIKMSQNAKPVTMTLTPKAEGEVHITVTRQADDEYYESSKILEVTVKPKQTTSPTVPDDPVESAKEDLRSELASAIAIDTTGYTADSIANLQSAISEANKILASSSASKEDVERVLANLKTAVSSLVKNETQPVDKTELEALVKKLEAMNLDGYTSDSVNNLAAALTTARTAIQDPDLTQVELDEVMQKLKAAEANLKPKESEENPGSTDTPTNPDNPSTPPSDTPDNPSTPNNPSDTPADTPTKPDNPKDPNGGSSDNEQQGQTPSGDDNDGGNPPAQSTEIEDARAEIQKILDAAEKLNFSDLETKSADAMTAAMSEARLTLQNKNATLPELQAAYETLQKAANNLVDTDGNPIKLLDNNTDSDNSEDNGSYPTRPDTGNNNISENQNGGSSSGTNGGNPSGNANNTQQTPNTSGNTSQNQTTNTQTTVSPKITSKMADTGVAAIGTVLVIAGAGALGVFLIKRKH